MGKYARLRENCMVCMEKDRPHIVRSGIAKIGWKPRSIERAPYV